mmetsp:Transcript_43625/g.70871  ORF Transcript_43625/g.70871 Transcript_43625/m.70871 type:complete len:89 (+) Transcript_43625:431-697(+)
MHPPACGQHLPYKSTSDDPKRIEWDGMAKCSANPLAEVEVCNRLAQAIRSNASIHLQPTLPSEKQQKDAWTFHSSSKEQTRPDPKTIK